MKDTDHAVVLPEFNGHTVDMRLQQFRKVDRKTGAIEFIDFDTEKGARLLAEYLAAELGK